MTEVFVDERGVLRVPLTKHTCHEWKADCEACWELVDYWQSFEAMPLNIRILPPTTQLSWDEAFDAQREETS